MTSDPWRRDLHAYSRQLDGRRHADLLRRFAEATAVVFHADPEVFGREYYRVSYGHP